MKYIKKYEANRDISFLTSLDLSYQDLTELIDLSEYTNLKRLYCYNNQLTSLPELPNTLIGIYCAYNNLASLPELPNRLQTLSCYNNELTSLPELPDTLIKLTCEGNQLPFEDLDGYKKWYQENKQLIDKEGLQYAYKLSNDINIYNV